jgi:putative component of toxin-antitoxin plasmid stabilization module
LHKAGSIEKTVAFDKWLRKRKDQCAKAKILFRIQSIEEKEILEIANPWDRGINEMKNKGITKFDIAEYPEDDIMIIGYLNTVPEEGDTEDIKTGPGHVAKTRGMSKIAE